MIVGLAGGPGAGKTTLAVALADALGLPVLSVDGYLRARPRRVVVDGRRIPDRNDPDNVDVPAVLRDLAATGDAVVEGHLVLALPALRERCDLRLWLDVPADVRLARKMLRQGAEPDPPALADFARRYLGHGRDRFERYVAPSSVHADAVVDGMLPLTAQLAAARAALTTRPDRTSR
jgi:uridine kinase